MRPSSSAVSTMPMQVWDLAVAAVQDLPSAERRPKWEALVYRGGGGSPTARFGSIARRRPKNYPAGSCGSTLGRSDRARRRLAA